MVRLLLFSALCLMLGCRPATTLSKTPAAGTSLVPDGKLWASFFQQRSAEYKALSYQAFNIATMRVDEVAGRQSLRPIAVVTDIDETFLDNSPYAVKRALQGNDYEASSWHQWTSLGVADTLPGALKFFRYAEAQGLTVFYITNREEADRAGTLANLRRFGFPFADDAHLIMRKDVSSKESRREQVALKYQILLLLGDNLADFSSLFDKKSEAERANNVGLSSEEFGRRFIILPNTTYGGWEDAFFQQYPNNAGLNRDSLIRAALKGY